MYLNDDNYERADKMFTKIYIILLKGIRLLKQNDKDSVKNLKEYNYYL